MAKVFIDVNYFIGLVNRVPEVETKILNNHNAYISTLTCHILFYVNKIKVPELRINSFIDDFNLVDLSSEVLSRAKLGPTPDLEDNIQLHSAAEVGCDFFLTFDKEILKLKFFGKTKIAQEI